jgi:phage terminase large subunit GpA-like protein
MTAPTDQARAKGVVDPPGYVRFPQYDEEWCRGLVAEVLELDAGGQAKWVQEYRRNEPLDCRNLARFAARLLGIGSPAWEEGERGWQRCYDEAGIVLEDVRDLVGKAADLIATPLPSADPTAVAGRLRHRRRRKAGVVGRFQFTGLGG